MKRFKILIAISLMLALCGLFSSCRVDKNAGTSPSATAAAESSAPPIVTPSPTAESPAPVSASNVLQLEEKTYSRGNISIKYPQITCMADTARQDKLNKLMSDYALLDVEGMKDEDIAEYELTYQVSFNSSRILSIEFDGYYYFQGAAHPDQFLHSLTLDVEAEKAVKLTDLVQISADFVELMKNGEYTSVNYEMTDEYVTSIKDVLFQADTESWVQDLLSANGSSLTTYFFLTKDALALSVTVPYVMGDHVEILLKYADLQQYKTDSALWEELLG